LGKREMLDTLEDVISNVLRISTSFEARSDDIPIASIALANDILTAQKNLSNTPWIGSLN
jgi:hypothetical protein